MNLIVAVDKRYGIGKDGKLLTHITDDLKRFKRITDGNILVMGRKTIESLPGGRLLPNRETWILSRNESYTKEGAKVFASISDMQAYIKANDIDSSRVFIAGGAAIYNAFLPIVDTAYITKIDHDFEADVFIDNVDLEPNLSLASVGEVITNNGYDFRFMLYKKNK